MRRGKDCHRLRYHPDSVHSRGTRPFGKTLDAFTRPFVPPYFVHAGSCGVSYARSLRTGSQPRRLSEAVSPRLVSFIAFKISDWCLLYTTAAALSSADYARQAYFAPCSRVLSRTVLDTAHSLRIPFGDVPRRHDPAHVIVPPQHILAPASASRRSRPDRRGSPNRWSQACCSRCKARAAAKTAPAAPRQNTPLPCRWRRAAALRAPDDAMNSSHGSPKSERLKSMI